MSRQSLPTTVVAGEVAWVSLLLVVTLIDLDHQIIPDRLTIPGTVLALAIRALAGESLVQGLLGLLVGGGTLLLTAWLYLKLTGVEGMGMGDVKLMAMVGALLGPAAVLIVSWGATSLVLHLWRPAWTHGWFGLATDREMAALARFIRDSGAKRIVIE